MKHYKLAIYILIFSIIWISCGSDHTAPVIKITSPKENSTFSYSQTLTLEAIFTDNEELDFVAITITGPADSIILRKVELGGDSQSISESFELLFEESGVLTMSINVVDAEGNNTSVMRNYDYLAVATGSLDLNIKLQYDGNALIMFEDYEYPDGKKIDFTRFSFYTSDLQLDETTINEVEFHNLSNSHSDPELASIGYLWSLENVPVGNYTRLSFNIGVPEDLNNQDPGEFPSGHPLAKPAENWFSWKSFIFMKIEGNVDLDGDGSTDTGVALHTGSNEALRNIMLDLPIQIKVDERSQAELIIDLHQLFNGPTRIFPIEENPQIHSLSQLSAVVELSDNLKTAINN